MRTTARGQQRRDVEALCEGVARRIQHLGTQRAWQLLGDRDRAYS
jgi:hypothetical protein